MKHFRFSGACILPYFAVKNQKTNLNYYVQEHSGVYYAWGEELIFGFEHGHLDNIQITQQWEFEMSPIFKDYILDSYENRKQFKQQGNDAGSDAAKLKMNSLYGKFGTKVFNTKEYVTMQGLKERVFNNKNEDWIKNISTLNEGVFMIEYYADEYDISSCVFVSSYITASARMHLLGKVFKCGV